jgi:hypothetical protein
MKRKMFVVQKDLCKLIEQPCIKARSKERIIIELPYLRLAIVEVTLVTLINTRNLEWFIRE